MDEFIIEREGFDALFAALHSRGYQPVGPVVRDGAIVYDSLGSVADLPAGWRDEQQPATYHVHRDHYSGIFGFTVGPQSWKKFLFPPWRKIFAASREGKTFTIAKAEPAQSPPQYAFIGVRPCELHAISILDKVFAAGDYPDDSYALRRERAFIVVVNCTEPGGTCFCASMKSGPRAETGFDLALTEILTEKSSYFVGEVGSDRARDILEGLPHREASEAELEYAELQIDAAADKMGRRVNLGDVRTVLSTNAESKEWDDVAKRCLSCANCTLVCPTCFCSTVEDRTDLTGDHAERWQRWDSCFFLEYAKVAGGNFRPSSRSRYRQWLTHKFAYWYDQFGLSGCVGCGRCITWCPVGIDVTYEIDRIRNTIEHGGG